MHPIYWICVDELALDDVVGARRVALGHMQKRMYLAGWDQDGSDPKKRRNFNNHVRIWGYVSRCEAIQFNNEPMDK